MSLHRKLDGTIYAKIGGGLIFPQKKTGLSWKPAAAFPSSRDLSTFWVIVKAYGNVNCCVWFLALRLWKAEKAKSCICLWIVLIRQFRLYPNVWLNVSHRGLLQQFCNCGATFNNICSGNVSYITNIKVRNGQRVQEFFLRIKPSFLQNCWLHFVHQCINPLFSTREKLFDCQTMHLIPCNGNLRAKLAKIWILVWFFWMFILSFPQHLSGFLPSRSQSKILFLYQMMHRSYFLFSSFLGKYDRPTLP